MAHLDVEQAIRKHLKQSVKNAPGLRFAHGRQKSTQESFDAKRFNFSVTGEREKNQIEIKIN